MGLLTNGSKVFESQDQPPGLQNPKQCSLPDIFLYHYRDLCLKCGQGSFVWVYRSGTQRSSEQWASSLPDSLCSASGFLSLVNYFESPSNHRLPLGTLAGTRQHLEEGQSSHRALCKKCPQEQRLPSYNTQTTMDQALWESMKEPIGPGKKTCKQNDLDLRGWRSTQQLGTFAAFPQDPYSMPSIHMTGHSHQLLVFTL